MASSAAAPTAAASASLEAYSTLRLPSTATPADVRRAYRRSALAAHPDRPNGTAKKFLQVRRAFELLNDPKARAAVDSTAGAVAQPSRRSCKQALPDISNWVEKQRFGSQAEACTFIERCQPFDFVPEQAEEDGNCTTFACTERGCARRWRVRRAGGGVPWVVEQEGELFASWTTAAEVTKHVQGTAREILAAPIFLGVPVSIVSRVLQEGYRSQTRRQAVPCSATASRALAAASGTELADIAVLQISSLPEGTAVVPRRDGGFTIRAEHVPPSYLRRVQ
mmetsp:Transcript_20591/g.34148  ORF Transcript_20591/g.34148 Transcript_20591/m.34148 type:complete len:280 (-) Transcript_20591:24-863(-)